MQMLCTRDMMTPWFVNELTDMHTSIIHHACVMPTAESVPTTPWAVLLSPAFSELRLNNNNTQQLLGQAS